MFAYCGNDPIVLSDFWGDYPVSVFGDMPYVGYAHFLVQQSILNRSGQTLVMEAAVIRADGSRGRIDILDPSDGSIWEIKHNSTVAIANAEAQLEGYLGGSLSNNPSQELHRGGFIPGGQVHISDSLNANYWYAGNGIILYAFEKRKEQPQMNYLPDTKRETHNSAYYAYNINTMYYAMGAIAMGGILVGSASGGGMKSVLNQWTY